MHFRPNLNAEEAATALTVADVIELVKSHGGSDNTEFVDGLDWGKIVENADESTVPEIQPYLEKSAAVSALCVGRLSLFQLCMSNLFQTRSQRSRKSDVNATRIRAMIAQRPAFLVCPNHQSFLDPFVVCSNYPLDYFRDTFHVGASEFWEGGFMTWVSRMLQVVPVNPDTDLMRAMRAGAAGLKNGKILHIYPEGERGFDGDLHEFKKGAAILATELDLPIVPVALDGLYKVWPRRSLRIRLAKVKVRFGEPFYARDVLAAAAPARDLPTDVQYAIVTDHLKTVIEQMIEEMRSK